MKEEKCRPNYDGDMNPRSNAESYPAILLRLVEENVGKDLNQQSGNGKAVRIDTEEGSEAAAPWSQCEVGVLIACLTSLYKQREQNYPLGRRTREAACADRVVVITEDVQNVHLLLEYRSHIDVSLTCEHDPKLQEYCVCPQNMPQFDSEGIPNQAPETNKPMILNGPQVEIERFRSGERGGQAIGPPLPIHRSGNLRSKYRRAVRLKCAGAPSCKKKFVYACPGSQQSDWLEQGFRTGVRGVESMGKALVPRPQSTGDFEWRNVIFSDEVIVSNSNDSMNDHRYASREGRVLGMDVIRWGRTSGTHPRQKDPAEQPPVRTPEELWDRVLDAWEKMAKNLDLFHNLVDSMPRRMRADVDAGDQVSPINSPQRREIRTHDQRPAREQIARSTEGRRGGEKRGGVLRQRDEGRVRAQLLLTE
ncbi:hypothetical protein ANN_21074 [Periplaneta americana]|uniref:Uncharacterized protein n=1 Tax=Periplaneta americana TaxID=6978 RepID=A0ABQ8SF53_PERAM|nr:hypothetical protein ANN_21074 [Periplaneta americana]